jgi:hypothetical protein
MTIFRISDVTRKWPNSSTKNLLSRSSDTGLTDAAAKCPLPACNKATLSMSVANIFTSVCSNLPVSCFLV